MAPPRKHRGGKRGRPTKDTTAAVEEESTTGGEAAATDEQPTSTTSNDPTTTITTAPNDTTTQAYSIETVIEESPEPAAKIARIESQEVEKKEPPAAAAAAATTIIISTPATPMTGDTSPITTLATQTINKEQPGALTTSGSHACEKAGVSIESIHPLITPTMTAHATVPTIPTAATAAQTGQASLVQSSGLEATMTDATASDSVRVTSESIAAPTTTSAGTIATDTDVVMESTSATESKMKESTSGGVNEEKKEGGETTKTSSFLSGIKGKKSQQPPVVISRPGPISGGASGESVMPPPSQPLQRVGQQGRPSATGQTTAAGDTRPKPAVTSRPQQPGRKIPAPAATRTPAVPTKSPRERGQPQVVRPPVAPMTMMQPPEQVPGPFLPSMEPPMFPPFMDELVQEYGARGLLNDRKVQIFQEFDPNVNYFSFGFEPTPTSVNDARQVQAAMMAEIESVMADLQRLAQDESQDRVNAILGGASNGLGLYQQRLQARTEDYLAMEAELAHQENSFIQAEQSMAQFQQFIAENSMAQQGGMAMNMSMNMSMGPMGGFGPTMGGRQQ